MFYRLITLCRKLEIPYDDKLIRNIAGQLINLGELKLASELYENLHDIDTIINMYIDLQRWDEVEFRYYDRKIFLTMNRPF